MSRPWPPAIAWLVWLLVLVFALSVVGPLGLGAWVLYEDSAQWSQSPALVRSLGLAIILLGPVFLAGFSAVCWSMAIFLVSAAWYMWARTGGAQAAEREGSYGVPPEVDAELIEEARGAIAERKWARVNELLDQLREMNRELAEELAELARREQESHARELREALQSAREQNNPQAVLDVRDRLVTLLSMDERRDLDREIARWSIAYLRDALHEGRARELIDVIERMVATFGESTAEGMELKNALPILRRSAGRCPDCGEPYDISLERCPECEHKLRTRKVRSESFEPGRNGEGSEKETGGDGAPDSDDRARDVS